MSSASTGDSRSAAIDVLDMVPLAMVAIRTHMRAGRPTGMSVPQFRALIAIRRRPGTDLSAVADQLGTSLPAASELVARLVDQHLVSRETDPTSRRRVRLNLTDAGRASLEGAESRTIEWIEEGVRRLEPDRRASLVQALMDLLAVVGAIEEPAVAPT